MTKIKFVDLHDMDIHFMSRSVIKGGVVVNGNTFS